MTFYITYEEDRFFFCARTVDSGLLKSEGVILDDFMIFGSSSRITDEAWDCQTEVYHDDIVDRNDLLVGIHKNLYDLIKDYDWYIDCYPSKDRVCIAINDLTVDDELYLKLAIS